MGKDINISSDSFISTEQLFSMGSTADHSSGSCKNKNPTTTSPSNPEHRHSLITKPSSRPPNLLISTTAVTTATNMSNGHGPSLTWR